jgi:glycosyltransferase involved in cell wall biosynthesis
MTTVPRLSVGLPVYNGEQFLAESLDSLLAQTFEDFELIISDNASTDGTADIARRYVRQDSRVRYVRLPENVGCANNHNHVVDESRGELFKWASDDDLYARDLLRRCVDLLDEHPGAVLAHSWTAMIDSAGDVTAAVRYPLASSAASTPERFRSLLFANGGDDDGAVIRSHVLRSVAPHGSYHHADRTIVAELALHGPFLQVEDWLYFRRDHPNRSERANPTVRSRCANLDPRRANRFRHPVARLMAEYVWGYASAIRRAPLTPAGRRECYRYLAQWLGSRSKTSGSWGHVADQVAAEQDPASIRIDQLVGGRRDAPA